jgi:hypothetical protein
MHHHGPKCPFYVVVVNAPFNASSVTRLILPYRSSFGFPWLTPHPTKTSREVGYFQKTITPDDLYEMYKRNQMAHSIVFDVAYDALAAGFTITDLDGEPNKELDQQVKKVYTERIHLPLLKIYVRARLYGSAELLLGYADVRGFDKAANTRDKVKYFYSIPNRWVADIVAEKDQAGNTTLPLKLDHYELSTPTSVNIDASRVVHIPPPSIEEDYYGESCLHHIFDVLTVLKNMDWSVGQTMFRHGAGFTSIVAGPGADQAQIDAIDNVVSEINAKTVITFPPGTEISTHRPGALDPEKYYYVICAQIAAGSNIPLSILMGTPKGARESSQKDRKITRTSSRVYRRMCLPYRSTRLSHGSSIRPTSKKRLPHTVEYALDLPH